MKKNITKNASYREYESLKVKVAVKEMELQSAETNLDFHVKKVLYKEVEKELGIKKGDVIKITFFTTDGRSLTECGVYVGLRMWQGQVYIRLYEYHRDGTYTYNDRLAYGLPSISRDVEVEVIGSVDLENFQAI